MKCSKRIVVSWKLTVLMMWFFTVSLLHLRSSLHFYTFSTKCNLISLTCIFLSIYSSSFKWEKNFLIIFSSWYPKKKKLKKPTCSSVPSSVMWLFMDVSIFLMDLSNCKNWSSASWRRGLGVPYPHRRDTANLRPGLGHQNGSANPCFVSDVSWIVFFVPV